MPGSCDARYDARSTLATRLSSSCFCRCHLPQSLCELSLAHGWSLSLRGIPHILAVGHNLLDDFVVPEDRGREDGSGHEEDEFGVLQDERLEQRPARSFPHRTSAVADFSSICAPTEHLIHTTETMHTRTKEKQKSYGYTVVGAPTTCIDVERVYIYKQPYSYEPQVPRPGSQ